MSGGAEQLLCSCLDLTVRLGLSGGAPALGAEGPQLSSWHLLVSIGILKRGLLLPLFEGVGTTKEAEVHVLGVADTYLSAPTPLLYLCTGGRRWELMAPPSSC